VSTSVAKGLKVAREEKNHRNKNVSRHRIARMIERRESTIEDLKSIKAEKRLLRIVKKLEGRAELDQVDVARLRLEADICRAVLQKFVPDVKQVDINATIEQTVTHQTRHEIDGMLINAGVNPEVVWKTLQ
jgi:hypothetical protein